jgi:crotonobetainyl-CoA:carnitine CoA-transferase CaiB-like acyl-CoA transferase
MTAGALDGLLVIALEQAVAAPYATSRLADAGARVIKIERPEGDFARGYDHVANGQSTYFAWLNRGKESVVLNIKDPEDNALLCRMIARADVFVENLAPGAAERSGFGPAGLRRRQPRLITCSISGYGDEGPYREMKAYDMLVQAESGLCSVTGTPEQPSRVGVSVCDISAGMYAHAAILEALIARERSGEGATLSVSLFASLADWMTVPLLHYDYGGKEPGRVGLRHPSIAPYEAFVTADDRQILISIQNEREWARFAGDILDHPEWAKEGPFSSNVSRAANRERLAAEINTVFARHPAEALTERLKKAGIAYGFVNSVAGLSAHPALHRCTVGTPTGPVEMPEPPARRDGGSPDPRPVPALGEHTEAVRKAFAP